MAACLGSSALLAHVTDATAIPCRVQKIASSISKGPTDEETAALLVTGLTALNTLELLKIKPNKIFLVVSAAGAVVSTIEIACSHDANVLAVVRAG
jgi:NADPH:quinone reductase-like Zn-dependent oxidoreductase